MDQGHQTRKTKAVDDTTLDRHPSCQEGRTVATQVAYGPRRLDVERTQLAPAPESSELATERYINSRRMQPESSSSFSPNTPTPRLLRLPARDCLRSNRNCFQNETSSAGHSSQKKRSSAPVGTSGLDHNCHMFGRTTGDADLQPPSHVEILTGGRSTIRIEAPRLLYASPCTFCPLFSAFDFATIPTAPGTLSFAKL